MSVKRVNQLFLLLFTIALPLLSRDEPSAFKAGDLSDKDPYGLTQTEQYILNNKKKLRRTDQRIESLEQKVQSLSDLLLNNNSNLQKELITSKKEIASLKEQFSNDIIKIQTSIDEKLDNFRNENIKENEQFKLILQSLTELIKEINQNYVSSKELQKALDKQTKQHNQTFQIKKSVINQRFRASIKKKKSSELIKRADEFMKIESFDKASIIYNELLSRKYKPARSNYNLGEIAFFTRRYKTALTYYKKSVKLYAKASYMPQLLLHSAMASQSLKLDDDAKKFLSSILKNFGKSKEAKRAKILLEQYKKK